MRALHEAGRDVPGDISVAGFDDMAEAAFFQPPLTTVRPDFDVVGRHRVALLLDQIDGATDGPRRMAVEPALVVRASTAPPPAGRTA
ncbi:substrate-binding domain-containing protein [Streptomyces scopuliridis]|uniref:Transcriptional regulator LacI/GalR-like sensor domain-containing protein n=1 Tax=Streptomyces scopuliridis RB72 TaxID=1440053 RepID=A0A2T7T8X7_9ACTN|nr:substrate-binding domain-containing protein [Streptomyces scopuliridis]PVE11516.1 hypothetical protein Y717_02885 [Streptomyces scopuliridis RB72]